MDLSQIQAGRFNDSGYSSNISSQLLANDLPNAGPVQHHRGTSTRWRHPEGHRRAQGPLLPSKDARDTESRNGEDVLYGRTDNTYITPYSGMGRPVPWPEVAKGQREAQMGPVHQQVNHGLYMLTAPFVPEPPVQELSKDTRASVGWYVESVESPKRPMSELPSGRRRSPEIKSEEPSSDVHRPLSSIPHYQAEPPKTSCDDPVPSIEPNDFLGRERERRAMEGREVYLRFLRKCIRDQHTKLRVLEHNVKDARRAGEMAEARTVAKQLSKTERYIDFLFGKIERCEESNDSPPPKIPVASLQKSNPAREPSACSPKTIPRRSARLAAKAKSRTTLAQTLRREKQRPTSQALSLRGGCGIQLKKKKKRRGTGEDCKLPNAPNTQPEKKPSEQPESTEAAVIQESVSDKNRGPRMLRLRPGIDYFPECDVLVEFREVKW